MKLVQLLAKELKEWPDDCDEIWQSAMDREIYFEGGDHGYFELSNAASDRSYEGAHVTREQWQAERENMNKPEWIRHRGGNRPIEDNLTIEIRWRDGEVGVKRSGNVKWKHEQRDYDIMAYRVIEETKDQEIEEVKKTNFGTITYKLEIDATEATKEIDSFVAKWGQIESPLKWRDEIIELEAYEEEFRREREKLIRKLESEGFKLIDHMAPVYGEQIIDMSDWRKWQADDIVRVVISNDESLPIGNEYVVKEIESSEYDDGMPVAVFMIGDSGEYIWPEDSEYKGRQVFEFVRRP